MSALTKLARGQPCLIRVPGHCNGNPETVVACHYRSISLGAGIGIKTPDWCIAFGCDVCHSCVDGRCKTQFTRDELRFMHSEGVLRTLAWLIDHGHIQVGKRTRESA